MSELPNERLKLFPLSLTHVTDAFFPLFFCMFFTFIILLFDFSATFTDLGTFNLVTVVRNRL